MNIKNTEFFKNIKSLPPEDSEEYTQLIKWEEEKCIGGITIGGIRISGWLYWHLNHWHIRTDSLDNFGNSIRLKQLPELRDNEWIRSESLERCRLEQKGYMEIGARQSGKDLLNSSLLYCLNKEINIGECEVGNKIYDDSGKLVIITGKYPQGKKPVYKITLLDGRELLCGLDHNWKVINKNNNSHILTTKQLIEKLTKSNPFYIETCKPLQYPEVNFIVDPYILGYHMGDGDKSSGRFCSLDSEPIEQYKKFYKITNNINDQLHHRALGLVKDLKKINVYNNKHIPEEYFRGSEQQRRDLLSGLIDSDGGVTYYKGATRIIFTNKNKKLIDAVLRLSRSLGYIASYINHPNYSYNKLTKEKFQIGIVYRLEIFTKDKLFKIKRKNDRLEEYKNLRRIHNRTKIKSIQYVYDSETTCITVDNKSHLFLTDNYTITHNSELEASFCGYNSILFRNTQNVIVGGNDGDLGLLKDKVDFGLKNLFEGLAIPRLDKTWKGNTIRLGYKLSSGDDDIFSYIIIRNADDGKNTETAAGTTAKSYIMDEVGKYKFSSVFEAAKPALKSKYGWRAVPLLVGTGGSFDKGADAERFFNNPVANNFLGVIDPETGKETCLFLSGLYRQDCKFETTLDQYITKETGKVFTDKEIKALKEIKIQVSDKEKARKLIVKEREEKRKDPDQSEYLKLIMYNPLTPQECFLTSSNNIFNIRSAKAQQQRIYDSELVGSNVFLYHDGSKIVHEFVDKKPISEFPHTNVLDKDVPITIWEMPIKDPPFGLYVAGVDPYRHASSKYSDSLGVVYIFKRMHDITSEKFQDTFVACYAARPDDKDKWNEQARLLIKYYNARTLCENDEMSFIEYMKAQGDARYLEKQPPWLKEIVPTTTVNREYGIHRSSQRIIEHLHGCLKTYLNQRLDIEKDDDGSIIREILGVYQVRDPMLLEEISKFNDDDNYDRIIAAELAVAMAAHLDPIIRISSIEQDVRIKELFKENNNGQKLFKQTRNTFKLKPNNLF